MGQCLSLTENLLVVFQESKFIFSYLVKYLDLLMIWKDKDPFKIKKKIEILYNRFRYVVTMECVYSWMDPKLNSEQLKHGLFLTGRSGSHL